MRHEIAIDLAKGVTETITAETWSGIDPHKVIEHMVSTINPEDRHKLVGNVSLRRLADLSNPYNISDSLRAVLAEKSPKMLEDIDRWAQEDRYR